MQNVKKEIKYVDLQTRLTKAANKYRTIKSVLERISDPNCQNNLFSCTNPFGPKKPKTAQKLLAASFIKQYTHLAFDDRGSFNYPTFQSCVGYLCQDTAGILKRSYFVNITRNKDGSVDMASQKSSHYFQLSADSFFKPPIPEFSYSVLKKLNIYTKIDKTTEDVIWQRASVPSISIEDYADRILKYGIPRDTLAEDTMLGISNLIESYFNQFKEKKPEILNKYSVHQVFAVCTLLAFKLTFDGYDYNKYMANVYGIDLKILKKLEIEFLTIIGLLNPVERFFMSSKEK